MIDIEKLKALAEAATPGPWMYWGEVGHEIFVKSEKGGMTKGFMLWREAKSADGEFIGAANPAAVLELITEYQAAVKREGNIRWDAGQLNHALENARSQLGELKAENEALRKDAERYHFLRGSDDWCDHGIISGRDEVGNQSGEHLDGRVDAAMAKEQQP